MGYRETLIAIRDQYAADLQARQAPPGYAWNDYEEFLLTQLERIQRLLAELDKSPGDYDNVEVVSGAYT